MKTFVVASLIALAAQPALAAKFHSIGTKLADTDLAATYEASLKVENLRSDAVQIDAKSAARGRSPEEVRQKTVESVAHTLCGFFDDGVGVAKTTDAEGALNNLDDNGGVFEEQPDARKAMSAALTRAAANPSIELYSGSAGGNNTAGTILGAYDVKNDQVIVFSYTNCGSDD